MDATSSWDKAVFFAGIKAAILAIDKLLPEGDEPPEVLIIGMLTDCDKFFTQMQADVEASRKVSHS